jgi:hypothetical protein
MKGLDGAFLRYRIMAWVTGVVLAALTVWLVIGYGFLDYATTAEAECSSAARTDDVHSGSGFEPGGDVLPVAEYADADAFAVDAAEA